MAEAESARARTRAGFRDVEADQEAERTRRRGGTYPRSYSGIAEDPDGWYRRVIPEPRMILGLALQWPVRVATPRGPKPWTSADPCPGCQGRTLDRSTYCALCHRSGLDAALATLPVRTPREPDEAEERRADRRRAVASKGDRCPGLKGGIG